MKKVSHWGKPVALLSVLVLSMGGLNTPATAVSKTGTSNLAQDVNPISSSEQSSSQLAQATNTLCRRVNVRQGLAVRERPDPKARQTDGVAYNALVTLAEGARTIPGPDGRIWIELTSPVRGYVSIGYPNSQNNLVNCGPIGANPPATPPSNPPATPPSTASLCRQVEGRAAPQGLAIRADAAGNAAYRGGVPAGGRVTLISGYRLIADKTGARRNWVEISAPVAGYVSASSLIQCR